MVNGVCVFVDNKVSFFFRVEIVNISEILFGNDDVEIVFGLIDVGVYGDNVGDFMGIGFGGVGGGSVYDGVFGGVEEVSGVIEVVEYVGVYDIGRVGVGVNIDFDGGVYVDDIEMVDNFGRVGDGLVVEEEFVVVSFLVVVEVFEVVGREVDGGGSGVVEMVRVEEVEESVLDDFSLDGEVFEVGVVKIINDGVGDVVNVVLERKKVFRKMVVGDFVFKEFN